MNSEVCDRSVTCWLKQHWKKIAFSEVNLKSQFKIDWKDIFIPKDWGVLQVQK